MKKFLFVLAAMFCVASASAQTKVSGMIENSKWAVGLRAGGGFEAVAEGFYAKDRQIEARLGYDLVSGFGLTALHVWNPCEWDWTPKVCGWFLDAGVGAFVSTPSFSDVYVGIAGTVKFGVRFKKVPVRLYVDYTPKFGLYAGGGTTGFYGGYSNAAISATYCF